MSNYWKIERQDYWSTAHQLKKSLKCLDGIPADDIEWQLRGSGLHIVKHYSTPKPFWVRLSLPFGLMLMLVLFILLPIKFMFTGTWKYKWQWLSNWFTALGF